MTYLNIATCYFTLKEYEKCVEECSESIKLKKSIKAYFRRGKSYQALKRYDCAVQDLKNAVKMDTTDPNEIQKDLITCERLAKAAREQAESLP